MNEFFGNEVKWGLAAASLPFLFLLLVFPPLLIAGLILVPAIGLFGWLSRELFSFLTGTGGNGPSVLRREINTAVQRELAASRDLEAEAIEILRQAGR